MTRLQPQLPLRGREAQGSERFSAPTPRLDSSCELVGSLLLFADTSIGLT